MMFCLSMAMASAVRTSTSWSAGWPVHSPPSSVRAVLRATMLNRMSRRSPAGRDVGDMHGDTLSIAQCRNCGRRKLADGVHVAVGQRLDARVGIAIRLEDDLVDVGAAVPVVLVRSQVGEFAPLVLDQLERCEPIISRFWNSSGSSTSSQMCFGRTYMKTICASKAPRGSFVVRVTVVASVASMVFEVRGIGRQVREVRRVLVELDRKGHVLGRHRRAVMKHRVIADGHGPGQPVIGDRPVGRQLGNEVAGLVDADRGVVDELVEG